MLTLMRRRSFCTSSAAPVLQSLERRVLFASAAIPDANHDGIADSIDYNVWARNLGRSLASMRQGDFNGDGKVDASDLSALRASFGRRSAAAAAPAPPIAGNWQSIFADEFDGSEINRGYALNIWGASHASWGAASVRESHASIANGILTLTATRSGGSFISGQLHSGVDPENGVRSPLMSFKFGYIEARLDVPEGKGLWPAFWMLPVPNPNFHDDDGEIDIVDNGAGDPTSLSAGVITNHNRFHDDRMASLSGGYHSVGVDWQSDHITWFVDGNAIATVTDKAKIPQVAEYFILGLQVNDGHWGPVPDSTTPFPANLNVDYVRVWQKV